MIGNLASGNMKYKFSIKKYRNKSLKIKLRDLKDAINKGKENIDFDFWNAICNISRH